MPSKKGSAKKGSSNKGISKSSGPRELIDTGKNKSFALRNKAGQFTEIDDVSRSLAANVRKSAKTKVKPGYGDRGDQPRAKPALKKSSQKGSSKKG